MEFSIVGVCDEDINDYNLYVTNLPNVVTLKTGRGIVWVAVGS
jgi:hypothetical protein